MDYIILKNDLGITGISWLSESWCEHICSRMFSVLMLSSEMSSMLWFVCADISFLMQNFRGLNYIVFPIFLSILESDGRCHHIVHGFSEAGMSSSELPPPSSTSSADSSVCLHFHSFQFWENPFWLTLPSASWSVDICWKCEAVSLAVEKTSQSQAPTVEALHDS